MPWGDAEVEVEVEAEAEAEVEAEEGASVVAIVRNAAIP